MRQKSRAGCWLQGDGAEQIKSALLQRARGSDEIEGGGGIAGAAAGVAHYAAELGEQRAETVSRLARGRLFGGYFFERRGGAFGGCNWIARLLCLLVFVGKEHGAPGFDHVPDDVAREHAQ